MLKTECDGCGKNIEGKQAYELMRGKVERGYIESGTTGDEKFCSIKCIVAWPGRKRK